MLNTTIYELGSARFIAFSNNEMSVGLTTVRLPDKERLLEYANVEGWAEGGMNYFLLDTGRQKVLFDTGTNVSYDGLLLKRLAEIDINPEDIDVIAITHMHSDHTGGLITYDGEAAFPKAKLYISKEDVDYWVERDELAGYVVDKYAGRLFAFEQNRQITSEVLSIPAFGHTPGHTMYKITVDGQSLLVWGDIVHAYVQFEHPEVYLVYDTDTKLALKTRFEVMKRVADENLPIAGVHITKPGVGKLSSIGSNSYKFTSGLTK
ncbi:hypothetical protein AGMMS49941_05450 [Deferribacterales bacterium]|nr:hypothetical protein AGMMS49941_05450 [Deferribacterales bacterium]